MPEWAVKIGLTLAEQFPSLAMVLAVGAALLRRHDRRLDQAEKERAAERIAEQKRHEKERAERDDEHIRRMEALGHECHSRADVESRRSAEAIRQAAEAITKSAAACEKTADAVGRLAENQATAGAKLDVVVAAVTRGGGR